MAETSEGGHHAIERLEVSDGTEKAQDDIEPPVQFERTHVRLVKLCSGQLTASNTQEAGVEIQAGDIKTMLISKVFGVFACATSNIKNATGQGSGSAQRHVVGSLSSSPSARAKKITVKIVRNMFMANVCR